MYRSNLEGGKRLTTQEEVLAAWKESETYTQMMRHLEPDADYADSQAVRTPFRILIQLMAYQQHRTAMA